LGFFLGKIKSVNGAAEIIRCVFAVNGLHGFLAIAKQSGYFGQWHPVGVTSHVAAV
jgi:hypothetical protein